jgi:hypothetical protein
MKSAPNIFAHVFEGNVWLSAGQRNRKDAFYQPQVTTLLADHHLVESNVGMFPLYLQPAKSNEGLFTEGPRPNLTRNASEWLARQASEAADLLFHCVAITHASRYRRGNAGALRQDWPRIPLPNSREALAQSAELGSSLAALLDPDRPVEGVTAGKPRPEISAIAVISGEGGVALNPDAGDLDVTAGWGHRGKGGAVMPAKGRVIERGYNPEERAALLAGTAQLGLSERQTFELVGGRTFDVYLNDRALLEKHSRARLGVHDRRLSSDQEMAQLSRARDSGPRAYDGRSTRRHRHRAPNRRDSPAGSRVRRKLRGDKERSVRVAPAERRQHAGRAGVAPPLPSSARGCAISLWTLTWRFAPPSPGVGEGGRGAPR